MHQQIHEHNLLVHLSPILRRNKIQIFNKFMRYKGIIEISIEKE